uniref:B3 domain-containing protein REM10-like n=1 Tax=Nicotiana tabacum TaxID=4097 RepID=A0A1S3ZYR0_TOBAC|nr:PREDICTED: B3 domain-containing protein REM10-like [Nicotiana tabacum]
MKKVPPMKPHFFKPILPGFKNDLKIPISFLKYLKQHEHIEHAILRRNGKKWMVKVNMALDSKMVGQNLQKSMICNWEICWCLDMKADIKASGKAFPNVEAANKEIHISHSHLICTIRPYCLSKHFLHIPRQFALDNRLNNRKYLRGSPPLHPEVKKKNMNLDAKRISDEGIRDLRIKTTDATAPKVQVPALTSTDANPHFVSTVKHYAIKYHALYFPLDFAKSTGLMNRHCEITLVDEKRRSWSVWLGPMGHHFGIKRGWREFVQENGVQIGDTYKFELINNGRIPIAHFHCIFWEGCQESPSEDIDKMLKQLVMGKETSTEARETPARLFSLLKKNFTRSRKLTFFQINQSVAHAKIPVGFLKYLKEYKNEHAILRRGSKQWAVKVNGRRFEAGWVEFAQKHGLQLGDMLIFRHEGKMEFEVVIFDSSGSVREYLQEEVHTVEETSKNFEFEEKPSPSIKSSNMASSHTEAATHAKLPFGQSHFVCTIRSYCLSKGFLCLPQQFAKPNGLTNKKCDLIIRDGRQRSWNLKLSFSRRPRVYIIGDGLRKFIVDNCLEEGDRIMLEVVTNGETPIWRFQVVTNGGTPIRKFQGKFLIL